MVGGERPVRVDGFNATPNPEAPLLNPIPVYCAERRRGSAIEQAHA